MYKKLVGILVMTLLITTAFQVSGIQLNNTIDNNFNLVKGNKDILKDPPPNWLKGSDQKQTENEGYGMQIWPPYQHAQEFKPTRDKLTAVALEMFRYNNPPTDAEITLSIREQLNGSDLTSITINADKISDPFWYMFDFEDISVIPEETYYIVCTGGAGDVNNAYAWLFGEDNKYNRGKAWASDDNGESWVDMELFGGLYQVDFCFITYFEKPNSRQLNRPILNILENYLELFPFLQHLFGLI